MGKLMNAWAVAALMAMAWTSQVAAAPVLFEGQGTVASSVGNLPASGSAVLGDSVRFSFVFDLDDAALAFSSPTAVGYTVPFSSFSATIGDYAFTPSAANAQLRVGRGFTFFGGASTEPSRFFSFSFLGIPGPGAPFTGAIAEQFTVSAAFRDVAGPAQPVTLADVTDPAAADRRGFDYFGAGGGPPPLLGVLSGTYAGGFAAAAGSVPEPATWATMLLGFGLVGGAMRRRFGDRGRRRLALY